MGVELESPGFTNDDARQEFYTLAHGATWELKAAPFDVLKHHRPRVAGVVKEELGLED